MNTARLDATKETPRGTSRWVAAAEVMLVFLVIAIHGAWPVPDVNEPHYLSKAKHYWQPDWCASDFFCQTADAHTVFYWSFGWLTLWLPLPAVAWTGRVVTWLLLAWSWRRLSFAVLPRPWLSVLTAGLFVGLTETAHMAGEWVVGGIEAKGFAFALVFFGYEALVRGRWNLAWLLLGAASAFHVLVGGWSTVAAGIAWLLSGHDRPRLVSILPGLLGGLLLALPGLWPAITLTRGVEPEVVQAANHIYVYQRLPHHLAPERFREGFIARHVALIALWLVLVTVAPADRGERRLRWTVAAAVVIAIIGFVISTIGRFSPDAVTGLLRFYWFRLSDVLVPLGVALSGVGFIFWVGQRNRAAGRLWLSAVIALVGLDLLSHWPHLQGVLRPSADTVKPRADKNVVYDDWRAVTAWAAEHTDNDARFLTPRLASTFKWYAGRGEVVNWKDIPQDAAGIVEWWNRLQTIYGTGSSDPSDRWHDSLAEVGTDRLLELAKQYQADYAIVQRLPEVAPLELEPIYENPSYSVYRLRDGNESAPPSEPTIRN